MIEEKQSVGKEYMEHAKNADKKQLDHLLIYCRAYVQYMVRKQAWYSAVCSWYGCADCASGMAVLFSNAGYR